MKTKLQTIILCTLLAAACFQAQAQFAGGNGTQAAPYQISTPAQLNAIRNYLGNANVYFKLINNIDMSGWNTTPGNNGYTDGRGWLPVGTYTAAGNYTTSFQGKLDGQGCKIQNMTINRVTDGQLGLFCMLYNAEITDLKIENCLIYGTSFLGGIAGRTGGTSKITGCSVSGTIQPSGSYIGGITGQTAGGVTISDCETGSGLAIQYTGGTFFTHMGLLVGNNWGTIKESHSNGDLAVYATNVGGIAGDNYGVITGCSSAGNIQGNSSVGGIAGVNWLYIANCYSTGTISSTGQGTLKEWLIGGIAGDNASDNTQNPVLEGYIENCYSTGKVIGKFQVGGLVGYNRAQLHNSYSTGEISGEQYTGGIVGANGGRSDQIHSISVSSVITNCYSMGKVSGTSYVGGVAGFSRKLPAPSTAPSYINNCFALNPSVNGTGNVNRIIGGSVNNPGSTGCNAWEDMVCTAFGTTGVAGADLTTVNAMQQSSYTAWPFGTSNTAPWKMGQNSKYHFPILYWQDDNFLSPNHFPEFIVTSVYNEGDKEALRAFLRQKSAEAGKINGEQLGLTLADTITWYTADEWVAKIPNLVWNSDSPKRLKQIGTGNYNENVHWQDRNLAGTMDLRVCSELTSLYNTEGEITALNIDGLNKLEAIDFRYQKLTGLNAANLLALGYLNCDFNKLTTLNVSGSNNLTQLRCRNNEITNLDVSGLTKLGWLLCNNNKLTTLDLTGQVDLGNLDCAWNDLTELKFGQSSKLTTLRCLGNELTELDVSGSPLITYLSCDVNELSELDVSMLADLSYFTCGTNKLTTLDLTGLSKLTQLDCCDNQLTELDVSGSVKLTNLDCGSNQLSELDLSGLTKLEELECYENQITTLDLTELVALKRLDCSQNQLSTLDVSNLVKLHTLYCYVNQLTELNISGLSDLGALTCRNNRMKLSTLPEIWKIDELVESGLYSYMPQDTIKGGVVESTATVDLSSEKVINGVNTLYKWYDITNGDTETEVTSQVTDDGTGKFTFASALAGKKLRCKMTNTNYWGVEMYNQMILVYEVSLSGSGTTFYNVWCNGGRFSSDQLTITCGEGTAVYDPATKTLTLTNVTIDTGCEIPENMATTYCTSGIFTLEDLNVVLAGDNEIKDTGGTGIDSYGSSSNVNISISGNGSLTITETAPTDGYGIYATGGLSIEGVTLFVNSSSTGLWVESNLTITDSEIIITNSQDNYFGIVVNNGNALIDGSVLIGNKQPVSLYGFTSESGFFLFADGSDYTLSNNGMVITYDPTAGPFETGSDDGIISNPAGVAVWGVSNGNGGIFYENGGISGFAATPGVTINTGSTTTYGISIGTFTGGSVTTNKAAYEENEPVTLAITTDPGYVLDNISAYKTGDNSTVVALSGTGNTRTFQMPAYGVTVSATFRRTQGQSDEDAVNAAKAAIEGGTYSVAQATANDKESVKTWLVGTLNTLFGQSHGIQFRSAASIVGDVTITTITPAVAGTESNPQGTNGSFRFTVTLVKGTTTITTNGVRGIIRATPFTAVKRIELLLLDDLKVRIINKGNVATGGLSLALSGTDANMFTLSAATLNSLSPGGETDVVLTPRTGLAEGTYTAKISVRGENITPVTLEITYTVTPTGISDISQAKTLKAWVYNGTLHVSGLTVNEPWSVYNISGALVYQNMAGSDKAEVTLPVRGVYIITSGNNRIKVAY